MFLSFHSPYERVWSQPTGCQETMRNVHKRIFLTFLRLSTHKENKVCKYNISYITRIH